MKFLIALLAIIFTFHSVQAQVKNHNPFQEGAARFDEGGVQGGGGDPVELIIKNIRDDLLRWIRMGGDADIDFEGRMDQNEYENGSESHHTFGMRQVLAPGAVTINVVHSKSQDANDELKNTIVDGVTKVCKSIFRAKKNQNAYIVCDQDLLATLATDSDQIQNLQYQLIHHEYAGLAGLEKNIGSDSDYFISKQLVARLNVEKVRRLTIDYSSIERMKFVKINAKDQTFMMGEAIGDKWRPSNGKPVKLTKNFEMQTTEVTQQQWAEVMRANPSRYKTEDDCPDDYSNQYGGICKNSPVETVSWISVMGGYYVIELAFPRFLSKADYQKIPSARQKNYEYTEGFLERLTRLKNDGCVYRLPTHAEWEFASRGGSHTGYYYGADAADLGRYAWYSENARQHTHAVAKKLPNAYGLYDMLGNVREWVSDYDQTSIAEERTTVGGGFYDDSLTLSVGFSANQEDTLNMIIPFNGFRVVRECK